jgi:hypothetical protein
VLERPHRLARHRERVRRYRKRQATGRLSVTTDFTPEETVDALPLGMLYSLFSVEALGTCH